MTSFGALHGRLLVEETLPFWLNHGLDGEHGGFFTGLDRDGSLVDTDKAVWMQGRAAWLFGRMARTVEPRKEWLEAARSCCGFLADHACDDRGRLAFLLTREGRILRRRRYAWSEAFAAMGFGELAANEGDEDLRQRAFQLADAFLENEGDVERHPPKWEPDARRTRTLAKPMIALGMSQALRDSCGWEAGEKVADQALSEMKSFFVRPDLEVVLEITSPEGDPIVSNEGRTLQPGHALEASWFVIEEANRRRDPSGNPDFRLLTMGLEMAEWSWKRGWDPESGGIFNAVSLDGAPIQDAQHDMKFWWPQCEAILAALHAWIATGNSKWERRYAQAGAWFDSHHRDPEHGECFGWLHRDGSLALSLKGGIWKGPFHYPRMQLLVGQLDPGNP